MLKNWRSQHPLGYRSGAVGGYIFAYKAADETVNNSATLQNDDDLLLALAANEVWAFKLVVIYLSGTTPDIKWHWTGPSGFTYDSSVSSFSSALSVAFGNPDESDSSPEHITGGRGATEVGFVWEGVVRCSTTAGNFQLQWAQNTQDASDTKVLAGSYLIAWRLA